MDFIRQRKSMLGCHRFGNTTLNSASQKKFEILPTSLQVAETQRKQRTTSNNENAYVSNMKNLSIRQPRKSMLGTRRANRNSIIPPLSELTLSGNIDYSETASNPSGDDSSGNPSTNVKDRVHSDTSIENGFLRRDSQLYRHNFSENTLFRPSEKVTSYAIHRDVPIREMLPSTLDSSEETSNSLVDAETTSAEEESILATTIVNNTTVTNDITFSTTLRDITNTGTQDRTIYEETLSIDTVNKCQELTEEDNDNLFKMLDLINVWINRNNESIEVYEKEIAELQQKKAQASEEVEHMENLKRTLMKQYSIDSKESEHSSELVYEPMTTVIKDPVFKSPMGTPTKTYFQEMRSTIKFMKTPLTIRSRAPRQSVMLTPHSMSFCLKSQYEQLFE